MGSLGQTLPPFGGHSVYLGRTWGDFGRTWGPLGAHLARPGHIWGPLGPASGSPGVTLGRVWTHFILYLILILKLLLILCLILLCEDFILYHGSSKFHEYVVSSCDRAG